MTVLGVAASGAGLLEGAEAALPLDEDLLFGRAALDTVRVYEGAPFRLQAHLQRLAAAAAALGLPPVNTAHVRDLVERALGLPGARNAILRLYWTSGGDSGGRARRVDAGDASEPGWAMVIAKPIPGHLDELRGRGLRLVSLGSGTDGALRAASSWLLPGVKGTSSALNTAAWREARDRDRDDAIMVDLRGRVLEGPATNMWWRRGETLFTPGLDLGVMPGITRAAIVELAAGLGCEIREGAFLLEDLAAAEEAFVTSTVAEVVGVVELDGRPIGSGSVGVAATTLQGELRALASASEPELGPIGLSR